MEAPKETVAVDEAHWATDWSAQELKPEEVNDFENVIADLYDWVVHSDLDEATVKRQVSTMPASVIKGRSRAVELGFLTKVSRPTASLLCCHSEIRGHRAGHVLREQRGWNNRE